MLSHTLSAVAVLSAVLPTALAQTFTACQPLNTTNCPDMPALGGNATFNFNDTLYDDIFKQVNNGKVDWTNKGVSFTISESGDAPQINSNFYMLFGRLEVVMRAAKGSGIISTAILQSESLDEIDWEFMGSNNSRVFTNYYGKGNLTDPPTNIRGQDYASVSPYDDFHNYTIDWTKDRIQWWMDGKQVREVKYAEATGGFHYPQTPMNIRIGIWAAGDESKNQPGVVEWAQGKTNFKDGPFSMVVQQVYAQDYNTAKTYSWNNAKAPATGNWQDIKIMEGKSAVIEEMESPHGVKNRFNALSNTAKIAIVCSVLGFVLLCALGLLFYCIRQRRAGAREFATRKAADDKEASELLQFQQQQTSGGKFGYNRL